MVLYVCRRAKTSDCPGAVLLQNKNNKKENPCLSGAYVLFHGEIFKRIASYFGRVSYRRGKHVYRFGTCDVELMVISMPSYVQSRYLRRGGASRMRADRSRVSRKIPRDTTATRDFSCASPISRGVRADFNACE